MKKNKIRRCKPQRRPEGVLFRNLEFAYVPVGYNWLERFILNNQHKRALRMARKRGLVILAANETVAFDLHRYYRVEPRAIHCL